MKILLGGVRDKVPVCASSMEHAAIELFVEEAFKYKELDCQGYKLRSTAEATVWGEARVDWDLVDRYKVCEL